MTASTGAVLAAVLQAPIISSSDLAQEASDPSEMLFDVTFPRITGTTFVGISLSLNPLRV